MEKHKAINYHSVQEAAAAGITRIGKEDSETNAADFHIHLWLLAHLLWCI
jgi:hypothetical protein